MEKAPDDDGGIGVEVTEDVGAELVVDVEASDAAYKRCGKVAGR